MILRTGMLRILDKNGLRKCSIAVDNHLDLCEGDQNYSEICLQMLALFVASAESPEGKVEEETFEATFCVFSNLRLLVIEILASKRLGLTKDSPGNTASDVKRLFTYERSSQCFEQPTKITSILSKEIPQQVYIPEKCIGIALINLYEFSVFLLSHDNFPNLC